MEFPVAEEEQAKCLRFLNDFQDNGVHKYSDQLVGCNNSFNLYGLNFIITNCEYLQQEISDRERKVLRIELDDILNVISAFL
jgi:hypothetical protein